MDSKNILKFEKILYEESRNKPKKSPSSKQTQAKNGFVYLPFKKRWRARKMRAQIFSELRERCIDLIFSLKTSVVMVLGYFPVGGWVFFTLQGKTFCDRKNCN